jgi:DNA mismatch repair protein MutS2
VAEARRLNQLDRPLGFGGIEEISAALERAEKGSGLESDELLAVARTAQGCEKLRRHLTEHVQTAPTLAATTEGQPDLGHVFFPILESFGPDQRLADHASDELCTLRRAVARLKSRLEEQARGLVEDPHLERYLQDRFYTQREERYVLPIKVEARSIVKGIVHGTSQSGHTLFVEPDSLVELNNQLKIAECEVADEERRVLRQLTGYVREESDALRRAAEVAFELDVIAAAAQLADELDAIEPTIDREGEFHLVAARHPLMVLSGRTCIANDIRLEAGTILVISGPNAGGKTVALKTAGLAALMVRAGLHVAAGTNSRVPWFDEIHTDIGDVQSIENELSTFSGHVLNLQRMLMLAGARTLLLIDELCAATEPEQGAALAQAVLENLAERRVPAIVTTHYERLKILAANDPRFANASVGFDLARMEPTFRLHLGVPGSSGAFAVARRLGMDEAVIARAGELLGDARLSVEQLMREISSQRELLAEEREQLAQACDAAERARDQAVARERSLREKEQKLHHEAHNEAVAALREARIELDRVRTAVKRRRADATVRDAERAVDAVARGVGEHAPAAGPLPGHPASESVLAPGTPVFIVPLKSKGTVASKPERGRVLVQVGSLRTSQAVSELRVLGGLQKVGSAGSSVVAGAKAERKGKAVERNAGGLDLVVAPTEGRTSLRTPDATLDLRGQRVDDALVAVDRFLDQSMLSARDVVFVIHGHGTGALRDAVREYLRRHPSVSELRAGEPGEGGDGVTVAWLDA